MQNTTVGPIHFEDFDGHEFERLVFAYMLRTDNWISLEWYGQVGGDMGRDIWGIRERDGKPEGQSVCVQCTTQQSLGIKKVRADLDKISKGPQGKPEVFVLVAGRNVSADLRDKIKQLCKELDIAEVDVLSGHEFEEKLRAVSDSLLARFVRGEPFPDDPRELRLLVESISAQNDDEILELMAGLFDRPAFYTPFKQESCIPNFKKAITDTIEALNTGVHRLRDGTVIRRIPSRHSVRSQSVRESLESIEHLLARMRAKFDDYLRYGDIHPCGCNDPDCPVFTVSSRASFEMDSLREELLDEFRKIYPPFKVRLGLLDYR